MRGIGVLFGAAVAKRAGPLTMGLYSLVVTFSGFAVTLACGSVGVAVLRLLPTVEGKGDPESERSAVRSALSASVLLGGGTSLLLLVLSRPLASLLFRDAGLAPALSSLALGLLPTSLSSALAGFFTVRRAAWRNALSSLLSQAVRVGFTLLCLSPGMAPARAVTLLVLAGSFADWVGFLLLFIPFCRVRFDQGSPAICKVTPHSRSRVGLAELFSVALPITCSALLRSALGATEHFLIPGALVKSGLSRAAALSSYGVLSGMALPLVLFPMAPLSAFASLLIPEVARLSADPNGGKTKLTRLSRLALRATLLFGAACGTVFLVFSRPFGDLLFHTGEAGDYILRLAPLVPVMFLDHITDALLKGTGEQVAVMWINIGDALLSVILTLVLLPRFGMAGYICLIVLTELLNFALSFHRFRRGVGLSLLSLPHLGVLLSASVTFLFSRRFLLPGTDSQIRLVFALLSAFALFFLPFLLPVPKRKGGVKIEKNAPPT